MKQSFIFCIIYVFVISLYAKDSFSILQELKVNSKGFLPIEVRSDYVLKQQKQEQKTDRYYYEERDVDYLEGLYLKSNLAYDLKNDDPAYDIRLEYDFYNQGYYEFQKKKEQKALDGKILFYRTLQSLRNLSQTEAFLKIQKYENILDVSNLLIKLHFYEYCYTQAENRYREGLITKNRFEKYKLDIQNIKDALIYYSHKELLKIPQELWSFINHIEEIKLKDSQLLVKVLQENTIRPQLGKALEAKRSLTEDWKDKIRLNVYAGSRKMYLSQEQVLVGVEMKIPFTGYSQPQNEKVKKDILLLEQQTALQVKNDEQRLKNNIALFYYKQNQIKTAVYELKRAEEYIKEYQMIASSAYGAQNSTFLDEEKIMADYIHKYTFLQSQRLEAYKILVTIMYTIGLGSIETVIDM